MSACKPQNFGRYRKMSHQERELALPKRNLYDGYKQKESEGRVVQLSKFVKNDLDEVISELSQLVEKRMRLRDEEDFPTIAGETLA